MENKDNKHINLSGDYPLKNYNTSNPPTAIHRVTLAYAAIGKQYGLIHEGSNGDLLISLNNGFSYSQNASYPVMHVKKYTDKDNFNGKTEAELLINSDNNEAYDKCPSDRAADYVTDMEIFY